jgi:hypothetical protein
MPHRPGHSPVPEFGIGEIGPIGTGGYNPNAVMDRLARLEASNQLYFPDGRPRFPLNVMEPYRQGIGRENLARGAAGFMPGVGTAVNWGQMGPWERALSVGLDAADLLTLGGGKALTTPVRLASRGIRNIAQYNPLNPKMISVRGGLPPVDEAGNYIPSTNYTSRYTRLMRPEAGTSVYQGAQFPFGQGTVFRNALDEDIVNTYLESDFFPKTWKNYTTNPLVGQEAILRDRAHQMYQILGNVMPGVKGTDLEAIVDPTTISAVKHMPFSEFKRLPQSGSGPLGLPTGLGLGTALPLASEGMTNRALNLFSKYDPQGTRIPNAIDQWLARANLASTIPATVPARGVNYTWDTPGIFGGASPTNQGGWSPGG